MRRVFLSMLLCYPLLLFAQKTRTDSPTPLQKLNIVEQLIKEYYVNPISESKLVDDAIIGMLKQLDPYSTYQTASEVTLSNQRLDGYFYGIGIETLMGKDVLIVSDIYPNSAAEKAGLRLGDNIVEINKEPIPSDNNSLQLLLHGARNSEISLLIHRQSHVEEVILKRNKVILNSVAASFKIDKDYGYIKLNTFAQSTVKEIKGALKKLMKDQDCKGILLDLRGNSGGLLSSAIDVANEFLMINQEIVSAKGNKFDIGSFKAKGTGLYQEGKLVVLVDKKTASASEIVAAAVQDWDRAIIVGETSLGKGLVQRPFDLPDGSRLNLTIANYYSPSGRSIQRPYLKKDMLQADSFVYKTKVLGRPVTSSGGVVPDLEVTKDVYRDNYLVEELINSHRYRILLLNYIADAKKELLKQYQGDFEQYNQKFSITSLGAQGLGAWFTLQKQLTDAQREILCQYTSALITKQVWGSEAYYRVMQDIDPYLLKAKEVLRLN